MNQRHEVGTDRDDLADPSRRRLLVGLLTAYTASLIPWALAQPAPQADRGAFMALSAILVGRQALDARQTARLYDALVADDAHFPADVQALLTLINQRQIAPGQLQNVLDTEQSPLAPLPRNIVGAWYLGVVGSGVSAAALITKRRSTRSSWRMC